MFSLTSYQKQDAPTINYPMINELFSNSSANLFTGKTNAYKNFMIWVKRSPQVLGFVQLLVDDVVSDGVTFEPIPGYRNPQQKVNKAEQFWENNMGSEVLKETLFDFFLLGNGYNWVGSISKETIRNFMQDINKELRNSKIEYKEFEMSFKEILDEDYSLRKKLRHVPATTVDIKSNDYEVTSFVQSVGTKKNEFSPREILHFKYLPLDGKTYGFAPIECLLSEVYLLWIINQNYSSFFENGGHPDKVFVLPKELPNSPNYKMLVETLKKYKKIKNKHGNLVFTGDINIEELQKPGSEMEHKELGLYLVGILALFFRVPSTRIPFLLGKSANNGDAGGLADAGYWRMISSIQSYFELIYNNQVFRPMGVKICFNRGYKQDEVREVDITMKKTEIALNRYREGLWNAETTAKYLGIKPEELGKFEEIQKDKMSKPLGSHNIPDKNPVTETPNTQEANNKRKTTLKKRIQDPAQEVYE